MADRSLLRTSISEVAPLIQRGDVSPVELAEASLAEIERSNPVLNAFRTTTPDRALSQARAAEDAIRRGEYRGPLHGIPLAVKDLMDMQGETTPAGSRVLADKVATEDSEVVRLLDAAGAVIVGKTHMPEFAFSPASNNAHYGPVANPWNHAHDTGGSSSGSGAAVAAGLVLGATGSDTGGSIRMPSTLCGIAGIKPTFGRVSGRGAATLSWSLDHMGPMCHSVIDAAIMLQIMAGYDPGDPRTRRVAVDDYPAAVDKGVDGLKIGVLTDDGAGPMGTAAVMEGLQSGADALAGAGATLVEVAIPELSALSALYGTLLVIEAAAAYEDFLKNRLDELGDFARDRMLVAYAYSPMTFVRGQQARTILRDRVTERMADLDLLILPGMPHEAPPIGVVQSNTRFTGAFNALGWPAMAVPVGIGENNLPVATQIVGRPWMESLVFRAARVIERDGPWKGRQAPDIGVTAS